MPMVRALTVMGALGLTCFVAGCSETPKRAEMVSTAPANTSMPAAPNIDRSKCNEAGKNVITADTNLDKKPDVWKYFVSKDVNGQKVEVLTCKQVDLNHDGKLDLV